MRIEEATYETTHQVALAMREPDYLEFSAVSAATSRVALAEDLANRLSGAGLVGYSGDDPVCVGVVVVSRPNVVSLGFFATDRFPEIGLGITRYIKNTLFPKLRDAGIHRIEAVSMSTHTEAHRWLEALGLSQETGEMRGFGKNGESFIQFAWSKYAGEVGGSSGL